MASEKTISEALGCSLITAENVFLTAFYNKVKELVENPKTEVDNETGVIKYTYTSVDIAELKPLVDFVQECYRNVSV